MTTQTAEEWHTDFFLALTGLHANEREVAGAIADVDAFCADSGQSPAEAFGDPRAYARQLGVGRRMNWRDALEYLIHVPTMLGIFVLFDAARCLASGEQAELGWGSLIAATLLCATIFGFLTLLFAGRAVLTWITGSVGLAASISAAVLVTVPIVTVAPWVALVGATVLLLTPATINTVQDLRAKPQISDIDPTAQRPNRWVLIWSHFGVVVVAYGCSALFYLALKWIGGS